MKKYLVNYATKEFLNGQKILNESAVINGIDHTISWNPKILKNTDFYKKNKIILDQRRGSGYWLWKPYIILEAMKKAADGDIIVYADSGIEVTANLQPLFDLLEKSSGILTFSCGGQLNKHWTKRDCFVLMDCDSEKYWDAEQRLGSFQLYRKCTASEDFIKEWIKFGEDERIITDKPNTLNKENLAGFIDHRHDQSIFSLLTIKNGIEMFRDPTQWGNHLKIPAFRVPGEFLSQEYSDSPFMNSPYRTILNHHRRKTIPTTPRSLIVKTLKSINWKIEKTIRGKGITPPPYSKKIEIIKGYAKSHSIKVLVETGTYLGDTIFALKDNFKRLLSIELNTDLYNKATERFKPFPHISIIQGDSGMILSSMLETINEPIIFWLDGHYSGGETAKGELDTPIKRELSAILKHKVKDHIILIDDARFFNGENGYPRLKELFDYVCMKLDDGVDFEVKDDIIRIVLQSEADKKIAPGDFKDPVRMTITRFYMDTKRSIRKIIKHEKD